MTEALNQKMIEEISKLPKNKQEAINSVDWASAIEKIGNDFGLIPEEVENLQTETGLVLIGMTNIENFSENIENQVELTESESQKIAIEVFERVFEPIANKSDVEIKETEPKINPAFGGLPQKIDVGLSTQQKIYGIGNKYKLPVDKMGEVEVLTNKFINGEISSIKYESELSLISELPADKVLEIINDINENIIKPKRNEIIRGEGTPSTPKKVPLPPRRAPTPVPPYTKPVADVIDNKPIETLVPKPEIVNSHDIYKEHGIEIMNENDENKDVEVKKSSEPINNIVTSKLFGNTNSKNVVNDYSIPKITTLNKPNESIKVVDPVNPHDPYREIL